VLDAMTRHLTGKLYADKGYIGQDLFKTLWQRGLHLITSIRRNMRNYLMPLADKIMLRKRFVIETVLDTLKSEMGLEHSRHRLVVNAMVHVLSRRLCLQTRQALHFTNSKRNHGLSIAGVNVRSSNRKASPMLREAAISKPRRVVFGRAQLPLRSHA